MQQAYRIFGLKQRRRASKLGTTASGLGVIDGHDWNLAGTMMRYSCGNVQLETAALERSMTKG